MLHEFRIYKIIERWLPLDKVMNGRLSRNEISPHFLLYLYFLFNNKDEAKFLGKFAYRVDNFQKLCINQCKSHKFIISRFYYNYFYDKIIIVDEKFEKY